MVDFPVKDKETFLLIGDSITDCGRRDKHAPLGEGYVAYFIDLVTSYFPEREIRWINRGINGNTIVDLKNRWHDDVLSHRPHWLSVMIGINDVSLCVRAGDAALAPAAYAQNYDHLLSRLPKETKLVLLDPFCLSTDRRPESAKGRVLELLPAYLAVVADMAQKYQARHVKTHDMFQKQLAYRPPEHFCPEPVHPNRIGHLLIALELWRVLAPSE